MQTVVTLEEALEIVKQLSPVDQLRLIETITPEIRKSLTIQTEQPRKSLRGRWKGVDISDQDIAEMRQEMWNNFPRGDI